MKIWISSLFLNEVENEWLREKDGRAVPTWRASKKTELSHTGNGNIHSVKLSTGSLFFMTLACWLYGYRTSKRIIHPTKSLTFSIHSLYTLGALSNTILRRIVLILNFVFARRWVYAEWMGVGRGGRNRKHINRIVYKQSETERRDPRARENAKIF